MTAKNFSYIMDLYKAATAEIDRKLSDVYDLLGVDLVELFEATSFESLLRGAIALEIAEQSSLTAEEIEEDLSYLIYDCGFDLADYCENVTIPVNGEDKHPILSTWEDYFNYLLGKD